MSTVSPAPLLSRLGSVGFLRSKAGFPGAPNPKCHAYPHSLLPPSALAFLGSYLVLASRGHPLTPTSTSSSSSIPTSPLTSTSTAQAALQSLEAPRSSSSGADHRLQQWEDFQAVVRVAASVAKVGLGVRAVCVRCGWLDLQGVGWLGLVVVFWKYSSVC